jgi:DNA-directed RNA polymerase subunit beta'
MTYQNYHKIQISIASPEMIRLWSSGEIVKSKTINYRTFQPEPGGLFCNQIFGYVSDLNNSKFLKMGHIELEVPILHLWYFKHQPSYLALILNLKYSELSRILNEGLFIFKKIGKFANLNHLSEHNIKKSLSNLYLIEGIVSNIDLVNELIYLVSITNETKKKINLNRHYLIRRYKLLESFIIHKSKPQWIFLKVLPVLPPVLRPLVLLKNNLFISSELNNFYRTVIRANNNIRILRDHALINAFSKKNKSNNSQKKWKLFDYLLSSYEQYNIIQETVNRLFDHGYNTENKMNRKSESLGSISGRISGKEGRFRQNLLGKRVNFSGRTVITSGPMLKLTQAGIPFLLMFMLFRPFFQDKIDQHFFKLADSAEYDIHNYSNSSNPNNFLFKKIIGELTILSKYHPVILNRAPTLHRSNLQVYESVLINNKSIQLHPLVCPSFNADFDGDQMAIHIPLTIQSQIESRLLMMFNRNLVNPSNGNLFLTPTKDMLFGIYYATLDRIEGKKIKTNRRLLIVNNLFSLKTLLENNIITLHDSIIYYDASITKKEYYQTTPGKILFYSIIPKELNISFKKMNHHQTKKTISTLLKMINTYIPSTELRKFFDELMSFGFYFAYVSGISFNENDLISPTNRISFFKEKNKVFSRLRELSKKKLLSKEEQLRFQIFELSRSINTSTHFFMKNIPLKRNNQTSSIYMFLESGARGSILQMRQLSIVRGIMMKPSGELLELPILSSLQDGLSTLEYFYSMHGARKGVIDTSIRTANAGYLTRKLVNSSYSYTTIEQDCGTENGRLFRYLPNEKHKRSHFLSTLYGRVLSKNIYDLQTGKLILRKGLLIDNIVIQELDKYKIEYIYVRSPIMCRFSTGICIKCYGLDLSTNHFPSIGTPIGMIASQSIGEPGTQLTMRTFHLGGATEGDAFQSKISSSQDGRIALVEGNIIRNKEGNCYVITNKCKLILIGDDYAISEYYILPYGSRILIEEGSPIKKGTLIASWIPDCYPLFSFGNGFIQISESINNLHKSTLMIIDYYGNVVLSHLGIPLKYEIINSMYFNLLNKNYLNFGDVIGIISDKKSDNKDITSDIIEVGRLFESYQIQNYETLIQQTGNVIGNLNYDPKMISDLIYKKKSDKEILLNFRTNVNLIDKRNLKLSIDYTYGEKGEIHHFLEKAGLTEILCFKGLEKTINYFIKNIQMIYVDQGIVINDKHLETIFRKMLIDSSPLDKNRFKYLNQTTNNQWLKFLISWISSTYESKTINFNSVNWIVQGITKSGITNQSFLSAASFQNTSKVLAEASIFNKVDLLLGSQENLIVGNLVPIGTGKNE